MVTHTVMSPCSFTRSNSFFSSVSSVSITWSSYVWAEYPDLLDEDHLHRLVAWLEHRSDLTTIVPIQVFASLHPQPAWLIDELVGVHLAGPLVLVGQTKHLKELVELPESALAECQVVPHLTSLELTVSDLKDHLNARPALVFFAIPSLTVSRGHALDLGIQ